MTDFNSQSNRVVWFDLPVANLERAAEFYRQVLAIDVTIETFDEFTFAVLAHDDGNGGCLVKDKSAISSSQGILVYMNVDGRIRNAVAKVREAGGDVEQEVHNIGPHGYRAIIHDSEGNRIALHSNSDD